MAESKITDESVQIDALPQEEELVEAVLGHLNEIRFSKLLLKSLTFTAVLYAIGCVIYGLTGIGAKYSPALVKYLLSFL